jgi:ribonucleoside-diphosphate reductase alpha chain
MSELSQKVFNDRYALKDENGSQIEHSFEEMWQRVARGAAENENREARPVWEQKFYNVLKDFKFVPGGRILSGLDSKTGVTFYNCFVIPSPDDSRGGILDSVKLMSEIMSRGGGVGVNISSLRPRGSYVKGVNGIASGSVSFGGLYSYATGLITQGGSRRGALMLVLNIDHADIEEFITAKKTPGVLTNANLSVAISDEFMEVLKRDGDWDLKWKGEVIKTVKASYLWDMICESAWASGEPGIVFLERYNKLSNTWYYDKVISTNPCGEQGLPAWGVCNLGSINLSAFLKDGSFNYDALGDAVRDAVRFLDNIIDLTQYHFPEIETTQKSVRRIGLGTMGLADLLIKLKIRYGSDESLEFVEELYKFIRNEAYAASVALAKEKGFFPAFDKEKYLQGKFIGSLPTFLRDAIGDYGIRNAAILTQAPTGTIGILADTSSGIEPIYDFKYTRKDRIGEHVVCHNLYEQHVNEHGEEKMPDYFVTAKELLPEEHIKMQAAIQKYVDASISKTVNAPKNHTVEDVKKMYALAYELGCKGVTYFREGSRDDSVLTSLSASPNASQGGKEENKKEEEKTSHVTNGLFGQLKPRERPRIMRGETYRVPMGYGNMYVTINTDDKGRLFEVFARIGKTGGFFEAKAEAICRLVSLALRSGINVKEVIDQLKGIRGPMPSWGENGVILSIPDGIAQTLEEHINKAQQKLDLSFEKKDSQKEKSSDSQVFEEKPAEHITIPEIQVEQVNPAGEQIPRGADPDMVKEMFYQKNVYAKFADLGEAPECPGCGSMLELAEGCLICRGCGYSKCA